MTLDLFSAETLQNPYPVYDELRRHGPLYYDPARELWFASRYADVSGICSNPEIFSSKDTTNDSVLVGADGAEHKRARNVVRRAFTPARVNALEGAIRAFVQDFVDSAARRESLDFVVEFADRLPMVVIAEILGIEQKRVDDLRRWASAMLRVGYDSPARKSLPAADAMREWGVFLAHHVGRVARGGGPGSLAQFLAGENSDRFTIEETYRMGFLLLVAGTETTTNLIGNSALQLACDPDLQRRLRANPALISSFIEEILRYESPVQRRTRIATRPVEVGVTRLPEGARVDLLFGAANRDAEAFPEADQFRLERSPNRHIAFGGGPHFCLGAQLARLEAAITLEALTQKLPPFVLTSPHAPIVYGTAPAVRGPKTLQLSFAPSFAEA